MINLIHRRKNSEFEDAFDMMNVQQRDYQTSDTPWKQLKKEKKAARKNRKNKRHENHNNSNALVDLNNPAEENNDNVLKSGIALFPFCYKHVGMHNQFLFQDHPK